MSTTPPDPPDADPSGDPSPPEAARSGVVAYLPKTALGWVASAAALLYLAGTIGYVIGARTDSPPGRSSIDVGFLQDMITHHEQAIEMSNVELAGGEVADVQAFAREILAFQAYEIGVMEGKLAEWGLEPADRSETAMAWMGEDVPVEQMPGLVAADEMSALLRAEGRAVDTLFVPLMQDHHRGGVHMADYAATEASDPAVRALAARMARNQRIEVGELDSARERASLDPAPPGFVPDEIPIHDEHAPPTPEPTGHEGH
jgi:uncharacterized protein (DUF305 family)